MGADVNERAYGAIGRGSAFRRKRYSSNSNALPETFARTAFDEMAPIIESWAQEVVKVRKAKVRALKLSATGKLEDSIRYTISRPGSGRYLVRIQYKFYGKYHDLGIKRGMKRGGKGYVTGLMNWVKSRGINAFNERSERRGQSVDERARNIAWGIIKKNSRGTPWKRRRWLNPVQPDIDQLQEQISEHIEGAIVRDHVTLLTS